MTKRQEEFFEKFLEMGIVPIFDEITTTTLEKVQQCFIHFFLRKMTNITVLISSNGGNTDVALEIFDILKLYPGLKTGIVIGKARSAASIILQACDRRLATPNSLILIHNGTKTFQNDCLYDNKMLAVFIERTKKFKDRELKILTDRTKKPEQEIMDMNMEEKSLLPEEALEFGLIDGVFTGQLPFDLPKDFTSTQKDE